MKLNYLTLCLVVLFGFTSCSKDDDTTPEPIIEADIVGSVNLYNEGVTPIDNSNMTVKVEGISPSITATTDIDGKFVLTDVPFGTYTLVYEKAGFGTFKKFNIAHTSTGLSTIITDTPSLGQVSTTQITGLEVNVSGDNIILSITTDPAGNSSNRRYVRYFLSANSNVSDETYTYFSPVFISQINPNDITISRDDLVSAGFTSGQTVYVKAYGDSFWSNTYNDPNLQRSVFPNLNINSVDSVSFVVP
jgi:hypothetical protein